MTEDRTSDTRTRLLDAAADLIAADPGEDFSLRAVCDAVGVKMPTLYHFFGNKQGLIEAVIDRGFEMYLGQKAAMETSGDPIQDIRNGWDAHIAFGLGNPGFYTLMYGTVRPGYSPEAQSRAGDLLRAQTHRAAEQGRLVVDPDQAASHVLVTSIGLTLRLIILAAEDPDLSLAVREGTIAAITGTAGPTARESSTLSEHSLLEFAAAHPEVLGTFETRLLIDWVSRLEAERRRTS